MPVEIKLTKGYVAVVDDCDADLAAQKWHVMVSARTAYAKRGFWNGKGASAEYMHRVILGRLLGRDLRPEEFCDHINGDGLNNCRNNLRVASPEQNSANHRLSRANTSGYKGVYQCKRTGKWKAHISEGGKTKGLGYFNTPEDAHRAYVEAALEKSGEYANAGGR